MALWFTKRSVNVTSRPMAQTRRRMGKVFTPNQVLGRLQAIGCVAVEITQRCNLDCTLCYLSEHSQSVRDIPIEEVYQRLDAVVEHYGIGTHVQITGGDPTLRKHTELVDIVRYARSIGLYPALFTNGIAASRTLLQRLAAVGLCDVAFHVDTTQKREGGNSERELNAIRKDYIERARGLGLTVIFNTTVHRENLAEIPTLVDFFRENADTIGLVSFQLQAETGRGEWGSRDIVVNQNTVRQQIERSVEQSLPWDAVQVGHTDCHNYLPTLVIDSQVFPIADDKALVGEFLRDFSGINWDRHDRPLALARDFLFTLMLRPLWWPRLIKKLLRALWVMAPALIRGRGRVHKMTFFIQNFMDARGLEQDRVDACSFMVMTAEGPVSMCEHNARRDDFILQPLKVRRQGKLIQYSPLKKRKKKPVADDTNIIPALIIND